MSFFLIAIGATLFLGFMLLFLLLTNPGAIPARLEKVTSEARTPYAIPTESVAGAGLRIFGKLAKVFTPIPRLLGFGPNSELTKRLSMAGYRHPEHAEIFAAVKIVFPFAVIFAAWIFIRQNTIFWILILGAVGFLLPDLWLTRAISRRCDRIRLALPDALDLLSICMEAGLGLDQALVRVGHEIASGHPELSSEFLLVNLEQRAGKPRLDAWRNMADRTGVENVRSFVHMLIQTERFGTPISKSLATFSEALRIQRRQQAEEMAAKTTIKMIPPLALFIFPTMFIVLLAPAVISILRNFGKALGGP
jgi:tight adherence protein C